MDNEQDGSEVLETPEEVAEDIEATGEAAEETAEGELSEEELTPEKIKDLKKKAAERDELEKKNKQLYERLKKAPKVEDGLSALDAMALVNSGITEDEDIEEAVDFAKFKKITVREAIKHPTLKGLLGAKAEERRSALAANAGRTQRATTKTNDADIVAKAERGETLETEEDMQKLFRGRLAARKGINRK